MAKELAEAFANEKDAPSWAADIVPAAFRGPSKTCRPAKGGTPYGGDPMRHDAPTTAELKAEFEREQRRGGGGGGGGAGGMTRRTWFFVLFCSFAFSMSRSPVAQHLPQVLGLGEWMGDAAPAPPQTYPRDVDMEDDVAGDEAADAAPTFAASAAIQQTAHAPAAGASAAGSAPKPLGSTRVSEVNLPRKAGFWRRALRLIGIGRSPKGVAAPASKARPKADAAAAALAELAAREAALAARERELAAREAASIAAAQGAGTGGGAAPADDDFKVGDAGEVE